MFFSVRFISRLFVFAKFSIRIFFYSLFPIFRYFPGVCFFFVLQFTCTRYAIIKKLLDVKLHVSLIMVKRIMLSI